MIKLSRMTDYAVMVLSIMAQDDKKQYSTAYLASETGLNEPTVAKILKLLVRHDILVSKRGSLGGYSFLKNTDTINMANILEAIEGQIALVDCVDHTKDCCDKADHCQIKGKWDPLNMAIQRMFEEMSLKQMLGGRTA